MKRTCLSRMLGVLRNIPKPPIAGYEISELPNEKIFFDFLRHHKEKLVIAVLHSGCFTRVSDDPLTSGFISTLNLQNYGHPTLVKFALVPGPNAVKMVEEHSVLTYPTTLLFYDGKVCERVVGARSRELSIKCLFKLRNEGKNIFSRD